MSILSSGLISFYLSSDCPRRGNPIRAVELEPAAAVAAVRRSVGWENSHTHTHHGSLSGSLSIHSQPGPDGSQPPVYGPGAIFPIRIPAHLPIPSLLGIYTPYQLPPAATAKPSIVRYLQPQIPRLVPENANRARVWHHNSDNPPRMAIRVDEKVLGTNLRINKVSSLIWRLSANSEDAVSIRRRSKMPEPGGRRFETGLNEDQAIRCPWSPCKTLADAGQSPATSLGENKHIHPHRPRVSLPIHSRVPTALNEIPMSAGTPAPIPGELPHPTAHDRLSKTAPRSRSHSNHTELTLYASKGNSALCVPDDPGAIAPAIRTHKLRLVAINLHENNRTSPEAGLGEYEVPARTTPQLNPHRGRLRMLGTILGKNKQQRRRRGMRMEPIRGAGAAWSTFWDELESDSHDAGRSLETRLETQRDVAHEPARFHLTAFDKPTLIPLLSIPDAPSAKPVANGAWPPFKVFLSTRTPRPLHGRLIHILAAVDRKPRYEVVEADGRKKTVKGERATQRKSAAGKEFNWSMLYMNSDAVASSIADRMQISKSEILNPEGGSENAAVKLALAETHIINETKTYLESEGVLLDSFASRARSDTIILVKNIPYGTTATQIQELFEEHGELTRVLVPPAGTIAVVEFARSDEAGKAFRAIAYRRMGNSVVYLEKGPLGMFGDGPVTAGTLVSNGRVVKIAEQEADAQEPEPSLGAGTTLFVKNLSFATTNERLKAVFGNLPSFSFARVQTKPDPKRLGGRLSMGYGFVGFKDTDGANRALKSMQGFVLDGHALHVKFAGRGAEGDEAKPSSSKSRTTKMLVKNVPFEATKKDIRALFGAHGSLKSVRVPKKFDSRSRGFAFLDFVSRAEAENAYAALRHTHLLGRHLVLEWAEEAEQDLEVLRKKAGVGFGAGMGPEMPGRKRKLDMGKTGEEDPEAFD
ncbi:hypothetical protein HMN09_01149300 [Mycena chlorophos]|uniref:Multiple RNA-binding domain-containing protein 1 n=1 Tax=Mycena chlorophos TaxID=658473 RepID=A0A8H6VUA8_MYCCL|nr:hypothetical protein HMN09_01149300 [Mycena chlorophos]